jgi:anti-anti-sigma factor
MFDDGLRIDVAHLDGEAVLAIHGEVDMACADQLRAAIAEGHAGSAVVVLDLAGVSFMDSSGLNVLIRESMSEGVSNGQLRLRNPPPHVVNLFAVTGVDRVLTIEPD